MLQNFIKNYWRLIILLLLLVGNFFVWYVIVREDRQGILTVAFLDVGQGDAIYLEAPNGNQVLIDGGPGKKVLQELGQVMPFYDRSIDLVIASHPDSDHIAGLVDVFERFAISGFMESGVISDNQTYGVLKNKVAVEGAKEILARRGQRVVLDDGVTLEILFPDRSPENWDTNDASVVAQLVYGENEFLLTGDAPAKIEKYLAELDSKRLRSDVLKAGHHGSRTSTSAEFVGLVQPQYAVISVGKKNRYGHPHPEVLAILQKAGAEILRTDTLGTIVFKVDTSSLAIVK
jgi:competence protein ComEC